MLTLTRKITLKLLLLLLTTLTVMGASEFKLIPELNRNLLLLSWRASYCLKLHCASNPKKGIEFATEIMVVFETVGEGLWRCLERLKYALVLQAGTCFGIEHVFSTGQPRISVRLDQQCRPQLGVTFNLSSPPSPLLRSVIPYI